MRIAIFPMYGGNILPVGLLDGVGDVSVNDRIVLAKYINCLPIFNSVTKEDLLKSGMRRVFYQGKDLLYFLNGEDVCYIEVVDVKQPSLWRISEIDGAEYIEYFSGVRVLNKYGMCEW